MTMASKYYATMDDLQAWAETLIASRDPDFVIGDNYLRRWWVVPRNILQNVYLHEINKSDDDRAMHDHPWNNTSVIIKGSYVEHTPEGSFIRKPGDVVKRPATAIHRLELADSAQVISLFMTGPIIRHWGFHCPKGFVPWEEFVAITPNSSVIGRGCGEMS